MEDADRTKGLPIWSERNVPFGRPGPTLVVLTVMIEASIDTEAFWMVDWRLAKSLKASAAAHGNAAMAQSVGGRRRILVLFRVDL